MIEVNLLPGGKKGSGKGKGLSFELPELPGLPEFDRFIVGAAAVLILVLGAMGYFYVGVSGQRAELSMEIEEAVRDSSRYADLIEQAERLQARRDSIAERVNIIQEIDADRYVWPHILDEVARGLPDFTWLTDLIQVSGGERLRIRVEGRAGNNFALTRFMENLEASPFFRGVTLIGTEQVVATGDGMSRLVNQFSLELDYQHPPLEMLETIPLFEAVETEEELPAPSS